MAKVNRIAYTNLIHGAGAVIVPSSEETAMPRSFLLNPLTSSRLRFKSGYTVRAGENDQIKWVETEPPGALTATIAAGTYATPALYAAAVQTAMMAAPGRTYTYTCSYSASKFVIASSVALTDLYFSAANGGSATAGPDLGFTATDKGGAASYTAESVSFQGRHVVNVDLVTAQAFAVAIVRGHNVSAAGAVRLDADAATMVGQGLSATVDYTATPAGTDPRIVYFASQSFRYLRLVISDVQNSAGYNELGVWFVGPYSTPSVLESVDFVKTFEQLSSVHYAMGGAHTMVERTQRRVYSLAWEEVPQADADLFEALQTAMPMGSSFFLSLDAADDPTETIYGFLRQALSLHMRPAAYWNVPLEFAESLP